MNDVKRLVLVACGAVVLILFCLFIKNHADTNGWKTAYKYNIAITATKEDQFNYDVDSRQGLVLSRGEFKTAKGVKFDEMSKEYTYVEKVHEQYNMHTETYECGTDKHPQTCTRTYYSWDREDSDERYSNKISYFNRDYDTRVFGFSNFINRIDACEITPPDNSGFFGKKQGCKGGYYYTGNDDRYYYNTVPLAFTASFLTDTSNRTLASAFDGPVSLEDKPIDVMIKDATNYKVVNNIFMTIGLITVLIIVAIVGYNWVMADGKWSMYE